MQSKMTDEIGLLAKTAKGIVSKLFSPLTQKESVRGGQKASRFGAIFQTAGILIAPLPSIEAQSSGTTSTNSSSQL